MQLIPIPARLRQRAVVLEPFSADHLVALGEAGASQCFGHVPVGTPPNDQHFVRSPSEDFQFPDTRFKTAHGHGETILSICSIRFMLGRNSKDPVQQIAEGQLAYSIVREVRRVCESRLTLTLMAVFPVFRPLPYGPDEIFVFNGT